MLLKMLKSLILCKIDKFLWLKKVEIIFYLSVFCPFLDFLSVLNKKVLIELID